MENTNKTLILGASHKPERYAYIAAERLTSNGHQIEQISYRNNENPFGAIHDPGYFEKLKDIDTVTLYLGPQNQTEYYQKIIDLQPRRVIFNPGTENPEFIQKLHGANIKTEVACTLVLLSTDQY